MSIRMLIFILIMGRAIYREFYMNDEDAIPRAAFWSIVILLIHAWLRQPLEVE